MVADLVITHREPAEMPFKQDATAHKYVGHIAEHISSGSSEFAKDADG